MARAPRLRPAASATSSSTASPSAARARRSPPASPALAELGIERVIVVPGSLDADAASLAASNERFAAEVLPRLRTA